MNRCPDPLKLEQLLDGQLPTSQLDAICQHVESCLTCQSAVEALSIARAVEERDVGISEAAQRDLPIPTEVLRRVTHELLEHVGNHSDDAAAPAAELREMASRESLPDQIADFRIIREIGRGGMGVVCEAEQVSLSRRVALKILTTRPNTDDRDIQRFQREARSAARLRHPHIVPVFGNGIDQGYAWYVMQLVNGVSVESFIKSVRESDSKSPLSTDAQAKLVSTIQEIMHGSSAPSRTTAGSAESDLDAFSLVEQRQAPSPSANAQDSSPSSRETSLKSSNPSLLGSRSSRNVYFLNIATQMRDASDALAHAHAQGIVHRDIKPSNLMIDESASIWVTDFGLAKSESDLELTRAGNIVGTLRYLAPEQLSGISAPSCDIYSLGATLYEMLTLRPVITASSHSEALEQIRAGEPVGPRKLNSLIPIDLETIALKAIARAPADRYRSAGELRDDLQRFIEGKPISARPVSGMERLVRWSRRNPWLAASVTGFLLLLIATAVGSIIAAISFSRLATREKSSRIAAEVAKNTADNLAASERLARIEETKQRRFSEAINDFVVDDFLALTSVEGQLSFAGNLHVAAGRNASLTDLLDRAAEKLELRKDLEPRAIGRLYWIIGISYRNVGQRAKAVSFLRRAADIYQTEYGPQSAEYLKASNSLAVALDANGQWDEAQTLFRSLVQSTESVFGKNAESSLIARYQLIKTGIESGDLKNGLPAIRELLIQMEQHLGSQHRFTLLTLNELAHTLFSTGNYSESQTRYEEALRRCQEAFGEKHPDTLRIQTGLATLLIEMGQHQRALEIAELVFATFQEVLGAEDPSTISAEIYIAEALRAKGDYQRALELFSRASERLQEKLGLSNTSSLRSISRLAACHQDIGHLSEARQLFEKAWRGFSELHGELHPDTLRIQLELAQALDQDGQVAQSIELATQTVESMEKVLGKRHPDTISGWTFLAMKYQQQGDYRKAIPILEMARDVSDRELFPITYAISLNNLAVAYNEQRRGGDAIKASEEALTLLLNRVDDRHPIVLKVKNSLAAGLEMTGQLDKALPLWEEVAAGWLAKLGPAHPDTLLAQNNLAFGFLQNNQADKAALILETGLATLREAGREHTPLGLRLMRNLAGAYGDLARIDDAIELYQQVIVVLKESVGEAHPDTLFSLRNLGVLCYRNQMLDKSIPVFEEGFAICQRQLGPQHPETLRFAGNLGINYLEKADWDRAITVLEPVTEASDKIPQLRFANVPLLEAYVGKSDRQRALALAEKIERQFRQQFSTAPVDLASRLSQIGEQLLLVGELEKSETLLREAITTFAATEETRDIRVFVAKLHLGRALLRDERLDEAESELKSSVQGLQGALETQPDPGFQKRLLEAIDGLIQIYDQKGASAEITQWRELRKKYEQ